MGLTKQYLRYAAADVFGLIATNKSNIVFLEIKGVKGRFCAVGACEDVIIWDTRTGEKHGVLRGEKQEVTKFARSPDCKHIAVGYNDGKICVFDLQTAEKVVTFSGHKSTVTCLKYDLTGLRLVSGGKDTDVIVWDIVNESGLYRLKGHKGVITQAAFLKHKNVLVTSSKDTFIKFWDLDTQHCFKTLVEHRSEVYDFVLLRDDARLVTGCGDSELRVWDIHYTVEIKKELEDDKPFSTELDTKEPLFKKPKLEEKEEEEEELNILHCQKVGSIFRSGRDKLTSMTCDITETALICHGNHHTLEVFKLPKQEELKKRLTKRQKKEKKKLRESGEEDGEVNVELKLDDEITKFKDIKMASKIVSADMVSQSFNSIKVICLFNNNTIGHCSLNIADSKSDIERVGIINMYGHQSDIRTLTFSSDNTALLSASAESVKVWNRSSLKCIRTMACDYALCSTFAPGDRHIILGTKSGKLQIFDIGSGSLLEDIEAHAGAVWSISMAADKRGLVSGSADKQVKFWNFELVSDEENPTSRYLPAPERKAVAQIPLLPIIWLGRLGLSINPFPDGNTLDCSNLKDAADYKSNKQLTLEHTRTLQMDEDVIGVRLSPNQSFLAVSLLDNTVKVFFTDTLKFFLSLYGHKLPVLCMDISSDSTLLVSGSADRNLKIWGLDFGDCHRSIFAHDDSIMGIQFIPNTHMFFTCGKDKKIKQWDADNFEHIITLEGHHAEIWCLGISTSGNILASGSHDKSLRLWEKTDEPLILSEEKEMEREKEYEESIVQSGETVVPGETNTEAGLAGKKSIETVKAAEKLMEAIDLYNEEKVKWNLYYSECKQSNRKLPEPEMHPMMVAFNATSPEKYVLITIRKIPSSELEEALLVLPFQYVIDLLKILDHFIKQGWEIELSCRCLFFLLRVHQGQITSNQVLLPVIDNLRKITVQQVNELRDRIGFNMAGLQYLQRELEKGEEAMFFADATSHYKEKKRKKRAILAIKT